MNLLYILYCNSNGSTVRHSVEFQPLPVLYTCSYIGSICSLPDVASYRDKKPRAIRERLGKSVNLIFALDVAGVIPLSDHQRAAPTPQQGRLPGESWTKRSASKGERNFLSKTRPQLLKGV